MKFTSVPKKLLLSGMSAAMVVAFAPAIAPELAQAAVGDNDGGSSTIVTPTNPSHAVATVAYRQGNTVHTQDYTSNQDYTDDDALQAALTQAAIWSGQSGKSEVKVTLQKDVTVSNATGTDDKANQSYYYYGTESNGGLTVGGKVTVDLNNKTLSNVSSTYTYKDSSGATGTTDVTPVISTTNAAQAKRAATGAEKTVTVYGDSKAAEEDRQYFEADGTKDASAKNVTASTTDANNYSWVNGKLQIDPTGTVRAYTYTTTDSADQTASTPSDADVTIENGTIASTNGQEAISNRNIGSKLKLSGVTVTATQAQWAIFNNYSGASLSLTGGTTVTNTVDAQANNGALADVEAVAIQGGNVTFDKAKSSDSPYDSVAKVSVTLTNGGTSDTWDADYPQEAVGIQAYSVTANATADVEATASAGRSASTSGQAGQTGGSGIIGGDTSDQTGAQGHVDSTAVSANTTDLGYGNYKANTAVASFGGYIHYGTYDGYVTNINGGLQITGGKFKYDPTKREGFRDKDGNVLQRQYTLPSAAYGESVDYRAAENDGWTYVYRLGTVDVDNSQKVNGNALSTYMTVGVPSGAKDSDGNAYEDKSDPVESYVQDKYLDSVTQQLVFASTGEVGDLGTELNDGNSFKATRNAAQPTLNVKVTERYGTPTEEAAKDGKYETEYGQLAKQAADNGQTAQGIYFVTAEQDYGFNDKGKAVKHADIEDLSAAPLAVTAKLVQTNSDAKAYKLGETNTEVEATTSRAVGDTINGEAKFQVAQPGAYGITVTTNKDSQAQADKAAAQNVIDAIDALPTEVTSENAAAAQRAVDQADTLYKGLTAAQKQLVTNYSKVADTQALIDAVNKDAADADATAAKAVSDAIAALPADITADNVDSATTATDAAQAAYDALTTAQKELVTNYAGIAGERTAIANYKIAAAQQAAKDAQDAADKAAADAAQQVADANAKAEAAEKAAQEAKDAADKAASDAASQVADANSKAEAAQTAAANAATAAEQAQQQAATAIAQAQAQAEAAQRAADTQVAKAQTVTNVKVKSSAKKKATVTWKKASGYTYQVKYRVQHSGKTADFKTKNTSKTKVTVKGLKSGKWYSFKVRTVKTVNGKKVYGHYSAYVNAKIK